MLARKIGRARLQRLRKSNECPQNCERVALQIIVEFLKNVMLSGVEAPLLVPENAGGS
jgi:hypothetical protein